MEQKFEATLHQQGSRVLIALPFDPNAAWGTKTRHHIRGTIDGKLFRGPLEAEGNSYFLALGAAWRRDNGIEVGATVSLVLWPEGPQPGTMADDITAALTTEPTAATFFAALPTFYRNNYVRWIESAKRPETRAKRIAEMVELTKAGKRER